MKKCVRIKIFSGIVMPSEKDKILEFKSDKMPYSTIQPTIDRCGKNPEHFSLTKIGEHIPCGYSISEIWGFDHIENKPTLYRGKNCMKKFCVLYFFKRTRKKYNWFWIEKNVTVNKSRTKITSRCKSMLYLWKKILKVLSKIINYAKVRDHFHYTGKYRGVAHSI